MSEAVLLVIGTVTTGAGLWLHDWRSFLAGGVCLFASWLLHDVDSCITRSQASDESEWLSNDLIARTVQTTKGMEPSE